MSARIFNLGDDERFIRKQADEGVDVGAESGRLSGDLEVLPRREGFSGAISLPLLPDLIQIYTVSMANGALTIRRGADSGTIWFDRGAMVHAVCGDEIGADAVYRLLKWHNGRFSLDTDAKAPVRSIESSWEEVLIEGCRRLDEDAFNEGSVQAASDREIEQAPVFSIVSGAIDEALAEIEGAVAGLLAVAVFDDAGFVLAQRSRRDALDLTAAGPAVVEMVLQQSRSMSALNLPPAFVDSFSILGDQVHLLVPLSRARLLYLAGERTGMNVVLARRVVEHVRGALS